MMKRERIFKEEAVQRIQELLINLANEENKIDSDGSIIPSTLLLELTAREQSLNFYVTKFVEDVLAYCHRKDFPAALIYTAVEVMLKRFKDEISASENGLDINAPLSEIKMDDTTFKFNTSSVDVSTIASENFFNALKPKLNLYRRVQSL